VKTLVFILYRFLEKSEAEFILISMEKKIPYLKVMSGIQSSFKIFDSKSVYGKNMNK
jgi:hypothetical protein